MKFRKFFIQVILSLLAFNCISQTTEDDFVDLIQTHLGGQKEVSVTSGYVDLLTNEYAIEVEFSNKWKQAIGQALWYGLQTNKKPGIVLIKRSKNENKYTIQLGSALAYGNLQSKIKLWVWPDDFPSLEPSFLPPVSPQPPPKEKHWLTFSTKKRHNSSCSYYKDSIGDFCNENEGIACKICGG